jgi:hypothetical protein
MARKGGPKSVEEKKERDMRKFVALATAALGALALAGVAIAGEAGPSPTGQIQTLEVSHSPTKASKKKKPRGVRAKVVLTLKKADGTKPSPTTDAIVTLPRGMGTNYSDFPTCSQATLQSRGPSGCPSKSKVGTGRLEADATPVIAKVGGTVAAYNGPNRTYLLYVVPEISSPLVIPGKLRGRVLDFDVPLVPTLPGQPNATLTYFEVTTGGSIKKNKRVKGKRKRVTINYLENPTRCSGNYEWKIEFGYENGERLTPTDGATCSK